MSIEAVQDQWSGTTGKSSEIERRLRLSLDDQSWRCSMCGRPIRPGMRIHLFKTTVMETSLAHEGCASYEAPSREGE